MCVRVCVCVFRQDFFVNANFIKHNRRFMSTYFLLDPFEFPYYFSNGSRRKYVDIKCLLCFNNICINEEMQPKYTYFIIIIYLWRDKIDILFIITTKLFLLLVLHYIFRDAFYGNNSLIYLSSLLYYYKFHSVFKDNFYINRVLHYY